MPRRTDIRNILIIGSGPIVIGQACEFDYSGTQACKALREEGYQVVLINSNPATIMTDPQVADRTYVEPITPAFIEKILERERADGHPIDALLPTLGGQTGLNCAIACHEQGILDRHGVTMIGASPSAIRKAEDRTEFKETMLAIGLDMPKSGLAHSWEEAQRVIQDVGLPCCIRPAYTLGGEGGGFCRTMEEFETICRRGLHASRISEVLIEEDLYGWKEFELEVMRDRADNVVIICSIENLDPMGVHTGDSITVAPAQTLTDKEYQKMRDASIAIIRAIGVDTGGCNIQFGVDPKTGRQVVIEMNPRVSRSSALASKATGYPIARIAAKLAVGYTLDELVNDITKTTPASFEPTIDYVVVKMPRWTFEKFPDADETLTTQMKSVGEAMAIGRTFKEAFQKCIRSMEIKRFGYGLDDNDLWLAWKRGQERAATVIAADTAPDLGGSTAAEAPPDTEEESATAWPIPAEVLHDKLVRPCQGRPYYIRYAFKMGWTVERVFELTKIDPWFLHQLHELVAFEDELVALNGAKPAGVLAPLVARARQMGYSDVQLSHALGRGGKPAAMADLSRPPVYKLVDTCAAEFEAATPYYYSSHETPTQMVAAGESGGAATVTVADEIRITDRPKVVILGGGPNRIGQGIEFDYCCCHASFASRRLGYESVMINSNPETVSTDFDTSDMLFFEPLTHEDVLNVIRRLGCQPSAVGYQPEAGPAARRTDDAARRTDGAELASELSDLKSEISNLKSQIASLSSTLHGSPSTLPTTPSALRRPQSSVRGVIVQFGGQTPLNLAQGLKDAGVPILGTQPEMIHLAEDREEFGRILRELSLLQPPSGIARGRSEAVEIASRIGYPVLVRPSYVLGGRGMRVCNNREDLDAFLNDAFGATDRGTQGEDNPILIDKFLADAIEVDVDAVADFGRPGAEAAGGVPSMCMVAGIMEHIEEAGIHSGDSTSVLPPFSIGRLVTEELFRSTKRLAQRLQVCGAMNIQYAVQNRTVYVLEVNPRASRTLPFVAKATGVPWADIATRVMLGQPLARVLAEHGISETPWPEHVSIKAPVFPFKKFSGVDVILGPEMRSTGEAMAIDSTFGRAFAKAQIACGLSLPTKGNVLLSVNDADKPRCISIGRTLHELGFTIYSTVGTLKALAECGIPALLVSKSAAARGEAPFLKDLIDDGTLSLLINTPIRSGPASDEGRWRAAAAQRGTPLITNLSGAFAVVSAIKALSRGDEGEDALPLEVQSLQAYFAEEA
jgi:carbamoyl-phosphate synthase large subunit